MHLPLTPVSESARWQFPDPVLSVHLYRSVFVLITTVHTARDQIRRLPADCYRHNRSTVPGSFCRHGASNTDPHCTRQIPCHCTHTALPLSAFQILLHFRHSGMQDTVSQRHLLHQRFCFLHKAPDVHWAASWNPFLYYPHRSAHIHFCALRHRQSKASTDSYVSHLYR